MNLGLFFIVLAILLFVVGILIILISEKRKIVGFLLSFCSLISMLIGAILVSSAIPTEADVFSGKAIYEETIHITNNDTIKTYQIVWKNDERSK